MRAEDWAKTMFNAVDQGIVQSLYDAASVQPGAVFGDLSASDEPISDFLQVAALPVEVIDPLADRYVRQARRDAAISGISLGLGGWMGLPPGLIHMTVLILRLSQRLSVVYGHDFRTARGEIELWKAMAAAVGANVEWEGTETQMMARLPVAFTGTGAFGSPLLVKAAQAVLTRLAVLAGTRVTRWVPVVGGGTSAIINYLEMDRIGRRLKETWRAQHAVVGFDPEAAIEVEVLRR